MNLMSLFEKPSREKFTPEEIKFLKKKLPRNRWIAKYAFYKPGSSRGQNIVFIIDGVANAPRKSGVENKWEVVAQRPLADSEYDYVIGNFGTNTRRFEVWFYKAIEELIKEDAECKIETPPEFVAEAKKRGYSAAIQLNLNFN